ncbi:hypothetical protein [Absidia glauca]|uniref:Uncharacterized protein n=1 Tax=Absidia glauca TaxID=4829 RepID=A0A163J9L5_ABSGL|nr:hypothetical protein [Absidia glauca]
MILAQMKSTWTVHFNQSNGTLQWAIPTNENRCPEGKGEKRGREEKQAQDEGGRVWPMTKTDWMTFSLHDGHGHLDRRLAEDFTHPCMNSDPGH